MNTIKIKKHKNRSHKFKKISKNIKTQKYLYGGSGFGSASPSYTSVTKANGIAIPKNINPAYTSDVPFASEDPNLAMELNDAIHKTTDDAPSTQVSHTNDTPKYNFDERKLRSVDKAYTENVKDNKNNEYEVQIPSFGLQKASIVSNFYNVRTIFPEIIKTESVEEEKPIQFQYKIDGKPYIFCGRGSIVQEPPKKIMKLYLPVIVYLDTKGIAKSHKINFNYYGKTYHSVSEGDETKCQISHISVDMVRDIELSIEDKTIVEKVESNFTSLKAELTRERMGKFAESVGKGSWWAAGKVANAGRGLGRGLRSLTGKALFTGTQTGLQLTTQALAGTLSGIARGTQKGLKAAFKNKAIGTSQNVQTGSRSSVHTGSRSSVQTGPGSNGQSGQNDSRSSGQSGSSGQSDSRPTSSTSPLIRELTQITGNLDLEQSDITYIGRAIKDKLDLLKAERLKQERLKQEIVPKEEPAKEEPKK